MRSWNELELTGRTRTHVQQSQQPRFAATPDTLRAFLALRDAAAKDGFDLAVFSSFRDFHTQKRIWIRKLTGERPLYDEHGQIRDRAQLTEQQIVRHIFDWSALPGASRHQWGTEIDVFDKRAIPDGYRVQLLPAEVAPGGVFYALHQWLDEHIRDFGFFRPYKYYRGGMFAEPWHLSFAPESLQAIKQLSLPMLQRLIILSDLPGKHIVLPMLPELFQQHILNIVSPDEQ